MPHLNYPGKTLFLAHRIKLIDQNREGFPQHEVGIEHENLHANGEKYVFTTVQTLKSRLERFDPDEFHTIVVDECHRYSGNDFEKTVDYFNPKRVLGFTATPNRSDGKSLKGLFDEIIFERDIVFGIKNKYLTPIHCERINVHYDLSSVNISKGDYVAKGLAEAVNIPSAIQAIKEVYDKAPKPALIFAVDIAHAEALAQACNIPVAHSKKTKKEVTQTLEDFRAGKIDGLVSVEMFTEGMNLNNAISLIMARPTQSELLYIQIVGRIVRLHPSKEKAYLFDCVGITGKHSLCTAPTLLGLDTDAISKQDEAKLIGDLIDDLPDIIKNESNKPESWIKNRQIVNLFAKKNKLNLYGLNFVKNPDGSLIVSLPNNKWIGMSKINHIKQARLIGSKRIKFPLQDPQTVINTIISHLNKHANDSKVLWNIKQTYRWGKEPITPKQTMYIRRLLSSTPYNNFDTSRLNKFEAATIITRLKLDK